MDRNITPCVLSRNEECEKTVCSLKSRRFKRQMRIFIEISGLSQKAVAMGMGVPSGTLTRWLSDAYPDAMGGHHFPDWTREVGPELEDWSAEQNDGGDISALESEPPLTLAALLAVAAGKEVGQLLQDIQSGWDPHSRLGDVVGLHKLRAIVDALIAEGQGRGAGKMA